MADPVDTLPEGTIGVLLQATFRVGESEIDIEAEGDSVLLTLKESNDGIYDSRRAAMKLPKSRWQQLLVIWKDQFCEPELDYVTNACRTTSISIGGKTLLVSESDTSVNVSMEPADDSKQIAVIPEIPMEIWRQFVAMFAKDF
jgi:hypothetical protein